MAAQLEDEKAQLRKRMRELEDELGGLRRVVRGRPTPLPAVGAIVEAEVTGHGEVVAFALLETFGTGFVHISEISRRIVITQPRGAAGEVVGAILPDASPDEWPTHCPLASLTTESLLPVGDTVWAEVIDPMYVGQLRLSLRDIDQRTGLRLPAEPAAPTVGATVRGVVGSVMPYGEIVFLPGFREPYRERDTRKGLLHRTEQPHKRRGTHTTGQSLYVKVVAIDEEGRIRLSTRGISQLNGAEQTPPQKKLHHQQKQRVPLGTLQQRMAPAPPSSPSDDGAGDAFYYDGYGSDPYDLDGSEYPLDASNDGYGSDPYDNVGLQP